MAEMANEVAIVPAAAPADDPKKKAAALRSWILMDGAGKEEVLEVDKYAIMHRVRIHARDLRILDPLLSYPSTILGRERAIVLNLEVWIDDGIELLFVVVVVLLLLLLVVIIINTISCCFSCSFPIYDCKLLVLEWPAYQGYNYCRRGEFP